MNGSSMSGACCRDGSVLGSLHGLSWTVTRLHQSPRGSLIVTALRHGRVASAELPERAVEEPATTWLARLEELLCRNAYDPTDSAPPLLVFAVSDELAELVPRHWFSRGRSQ